MVLLTPAHISLLSDSHTFVSSTIKRCFWPNRLGQKFDIIFAVVDRIPLPKASQISHEDLGSIQFLSSQRSIDGYEGISVAVMDSELAAPDLWMKGREVYIKAAAITNQLSTLSFGFHRANKRSGKEVQIPLANTVFLNGRPTTLLAQRWIKGTIKESRVNLACIREVILEKQTLRMTRSTDSHITESSTEMDTRLRPITPPRAVTAVTGNIVRQVEVDGNVSRPASKELEEAITDRLQSSRLERFKAEVWAMTKPQDTFAAKESLGVDFDLNRDIAQGARLYKVLSGGGGWGVKQGLLALDSDAGYSARDSQLDQERSFEEMDESELFANVAHIGDTITFLTNEEVGGGQKEANIHNCETLSGPWKLNLQENLIEFGCLPSRKDEIPTAEPSTSELGSLPLSIVVKNYFGMLSEAGMSFKVSIYIVMDW